MNEIRSTDLEINPRGAVEVSKNAKQRVFSVPEGGLDDNSPRLVWDRNNTIHDSDPKDMSG